MEQLRSYLLHEYDIVPTSMKQVQSVWKVTSDKGTFAVKISKQTAQHLAFVQQNLLYMQQAGVTGVLPFIPTKGGQPFIPLVDGAIYVVPWIEGATGKEIIQKPHILEAMFTQLGSMHRLGMGRYREQLGTLFYEGERLQKSWNGRINRLQEFREQVNKRVYPSPIDVVFMANIDQLLEVTIEATGRLEEWLKATEDAEEIRLTLCHGRLGIDHMIFAEQSYFINFDHANLDFPARDLSFLLRHLISRMGDQTRLEGWLELYLQHNSLTSDELEILNISLQYPSSVIQFLERYYTEQFAGRWTELTLVRRFEKLIDEQQLLHYL